MRCPECGSDDIQFVTKTTGGGFSFSNACCGRILLGPWGLLCGACGSGARTREFWICKKCGHKFANWEGQIHQKLDDFNQKIADDNYIGSKQIRDKAIQEFGDIARIVAFADESNKRLESLTAEYESMRKMLLTVNVDKETKKLQKKSEGPSCLGALVFFALAWGGIAGLFTRGLGFGPAWIMLGIAFLMLVVVCLKTANAEEKINEKFSQTSPRFQEIYQRLEKEKKENENWKKIINAINECENYEQEK